MDRKEGTMKYRINGVVIGGKYCGEVEANSKEEAIEKAWYELDCSVSLCSQCTDECGDLEVEDLEAEEVYEGQDK
jgi:hypothetical protein